MSLGDARRLENALKRQKGEPGVDTLKRKRPVGDLGLKY